MKKHLLGLIGSLALSIGTTYAAPSATATLNGASFIQAGTIVNNALSGVSITAIIYSLGTAGNGIATWDTATGGGVASGYLSNPEWFQTVTWSGLSVAPGASFSFSGLDIDLITTLSPLVIDEGTISPTGASLANAYIKVVWSDGEMGQASLVQQDWAQTQNLTINPDNRVPDAGSSLVLLGLALGALGFYGRAHHGKLALAAK